MTQAYQSRKPFSQDLVASAGRIGRSFVPVMSFDGGATVEKVDMETSCPEEARAAARREIAVIVVGTGNRPLSRALTFLIVILTSLNVLGPDNAIYNWVAGIALCLCVAAMVPALVWENRRITELRREAEEKIRVE